MDTGRPRYTAHPYPYEKASSGGGTRVRKLTTVKSKEAQNLNGDHGAELKFHTKRRRPGPFRITKRLSATGS